MASVLVSGRRYIQFCPNVHYRCRFPVSTRDGPQVLERDACDALIPSYSRERDEPESSLIAVQTNGDAALGFLCCSSFPAPNISRIL